MTTRGMITVGDGTMDERQRRIRARNRALLAVLLTLVALFYVILTPVWIGLRVAAWIAEFRARRRS